MKRGCLAALCAVALAGTLCGCGAPKLTLSAQELYCLPELPEKYTALNARLAEILDHGAEYAAPLSGSNIQPVQLADLNGDGREEAVACFRKADDEKPLKIYIFSGDANDYRQTALIEGSGTAIFSMVYSDMTGDGHMELAVGWRVGAELQALTVYALRPEGPVELLRTDYVKYALADMDGSGSRSLTVFRDGEAGAGIADYYVWSDGTLLRQTAMPLSGTMAELKQRGQISVGALQDGTPALFVTTVAETGYAKVDILTLRDGTLTAIGSGEPVPFCGLYPADINGDGVTEIPRPTPLPLLKADISIYDRTDWRSYEKDGSSELVLSTFHNHADGWYLRLPADWSGRIGVERAVTVEEASVTFYALKGGGTQRLPFLRITAVTDTSSERRILRGSRFVLNRRTGAVYTAELLEGNASWEYGVTEDEVRAMFSLIAPEWTAGDN